MKSSAHCTLHGEKVLTFKKNGNRHGWMCRQCKNDHFKKRKYNVTVEQIEQMIREQSNQCAICETQMDRPFIDHCHSTGKVRGLLCVKCNFGVGYFQDSVKLLQNAISYLNQKAPIE